MTWIEEHKRNWRMVILILLVLAIIMPWAFDRVNVPAEYDCGPSYIRLEGDFCGSPISGIRIYSGMIGGFFIMIIGLVPGKNVFAETGFNIWVSLIYSLVLILLILPIINILFMIRHGDRPHLQKFHLLICSINLIPVLFLGLSSFPHIYLPRLGVWLYLGSLISILILEGLLLKRRNTSQLA